MDCSRTSDWIVQVGKERKHGSAVEIIQMEQWRENSNGAMETSFNLKNRINVWKWEALKK
jgi:hypothetical protein